MCLEGGGTPRPIIIVRVYFSLIKLDVGNEEHLNLNLNAAAKQNKQKPRYPIIIIIIIIIYEK